jgi:hypothetical protein
MGLVALVIGASLTVSATERVTVSLVVADSVAWSFVPALQLLTGLFLIRGIRTSSRLDLLDRYFATGWAWSIWILGVHASLLMLPATRRFGVLAIAAAAAIPILWTMRLLLNYCRHDLGLDSHRARIRVGQHQVVTYTLFLTYVFFAVSLWPRIVGLFA